MNCYSDYYAYCSKHTAGSAGCHACMRANRSKLSNACVTALVADGVLKGGKGATKKTELAGAAKARASRTTRLAVTAKVAKLPSAKAADMPARKTEPQASVNKAALQTSIDRPPLAPQPPAAQPDPPAKPPGMDQQTFEALQNRKPYFVVQEDLASIFSRADEKPNTQPSPPAR